LAAAAAASAASTAFKTRQRWLGREKKLIWIQFEKNMEKMEKNSQKTLPG
jgi:hypothetical protein